MLRRRICTAVFDYRLPWPRLSDDPDEQWLLCEALAAAHHAEQQQEQQMTERRQQAQRDAEGLLAQHRASVGHG